MFICNPNKTVILVLVALLVVISQLAWSDEVPIYPPLAKGAKAEVVKVAAEHEEQFVRRGIRLIDSELQEIVDRVAATVLPAVADAFINFRVYLIRDPSPAAFSLADGQIYVHTGLLARLESEAQLAAVLAHEAHHVAAHHHIAADKYRRLRGNVSGAAAGLLNRNAAEGISYDKEFRYITQSEFSEDMEYEADAGSVALISRAGYAPVAAVRALERLRSDPELSIDRQIASFNTPESLLERQGRLQALVGSLKQDANHGAAGERPLQLRRVIDMTIDDYIRLDRPGAALKFAESLIAVQPDAFLYAAKGDAHHALGPRGVDLQKEFLLWTVVGKRAEKTREEEFAKYLATEGGPERLAYNLDSAAKAYEMAIQLDETNARAHRGLGNLYFEQKDHRQAGRNYVKYLKFAPDSIDRPFILERLQNIKVELTKQKQEGQP